MKPFALSLVAGTMLLATAAPSEAGNRGGGGHAARAGGAHSGTARARSVARYTGVRSRGVRHSVPYISGIRRAVPRVGVVVGVPAWGYYAPPYYYPPAYTSPDYYYYEPYPAEYDAPPVYVEPGSGQAAPATNWWYYCPASQTYFPYVQECAGGWQRVVPQPPPG